MTAPLSLKVQMLKIEVIETLLWECVTWTLGAIKVASLRPVHYQVLLRIPGLTPPALRLLDRFLG